MKNLFIEKKICYDGSQLRSLFTYRNHEILGDSTVSWIGPCNIPFVHMVDGEDLNAKAEIRGDEMLHFVVEKFNTTLIGMVALQRLFTSMCIDLLREVSLDRELASRLKRKGDDIYVQEKKLSISVATQSPVSSLMHFALNITNRGTPVKTLSLQDLKVDPREFATLLMGQFCEEVEDIERATQKVHWVK